MFAIVVTAATVPGNAGIDRNERQPLNMLSMLVTAATVPGKAGMV